MAGMTARAPTPNPGIMSSYKRGLTLQRKSNPGLIEQMRDSVLYWLLNEYGRVEDDIIAQDASIVDGIMKVFRGLLNRWQKKFDDYADIRAKWLARRVNTNTLNQLKGAMREAGLTVKFRNTPRVNMMLDAIIAENVGLIKSIPSQFLGEVQTIVLESVKNGRDMGYIAQQVRKEYGISRRRAIVIARDQTNKATEAVSRARAEEMGIEYGFWMHRGGGKVPRPTHIGVMNGKRFKLSEGLYDPQAERVRGGGYRGRKVKPAELINCHCTYLLDLTGVISHDAAMDSKRGVMRIVRPGAVIEWRMAA